ncbi:MAG: hypothetical protein BGN97_13950 [Microbacterium sp. 69-10]|uniref:hypothetical protein n=1 Tax=Microbacterium sp. 69-10 TaxID=1895783 RepID=UPI00095AB326|nr:hypothetical protein [Microbacterium sp. 69-10]OJU39923.1 MAG: hypothetical protein BGN97_13950 [Microbacterium sp. 69-10]
MSENDTSTPDLPAAVTRPKRSTARNAILVGAAAAAAMAAVVTIAVIVSRPSAIEVAGETCAGSKPLDAFLAEARATASATPAPDPRETEADDALAELFAGVVSVEDDGKTLIVNTKPKDDDPLGVTSLALECVYEQLDVPTRITERIGATRSLDGRQEGDWKGFTASWSYHPDSGANLIIVEN